MRIKTLLISLAFLAAMLPEPVLAGDACPGTRGEMTCSTLIADTMTFSDPSNLGFYSCGSPFAGIDQAGPDHVYSFTCQSTGPATLVLDNTTCDFDLYVLDSSCDSDTGCLEGNTDAASTSEVTFACVHGETYYVAVEGFGFLGGSGVENCSADEQYQLSVIPGLGTACPEDCDDGIDNDDDGDIDCSDSDCSSDPVCNVCDADEDGFDSLLCGGEDCDDSNPLVFPGAIEVCGDGIDNNCDSFGGPEDDDDEDGCDWNSENAAGTDACDADTDDDFLSDGAEMLANCAIDEGETSPLLADTDDDTFIDSLELACESDPLDPASTPGLCPVFDDSFENSTQ